MDGGAVGDLRGNHHPALAGIRLRLQLPGGDADGDEVRTVLAVAIDYTALSGGAFGLCDYDLEGCHREKKKSPFHCLSLYRNSIFVQF